MIYILSDLKGETTTSKSLNTPTVCTPVDVCASVSKLQLMGEWQTLKHNRFFRFC